MPRFSVIVPVFKVQAHLHDCLGSVLSQSYDDLELIAVDDCSPDASGAILDEHAARDRRVTALHLASTTGPGPARNAGLAHATGDYVLFLDADDALAPGALQAVADRLKETGDPDVLVYGHARYDHARTSPSGEQVRDPAAAQLTETGPATFRLADRPGLLRLTGAVWNKAYRRAFVEEQGLGFTAGCYEDVPWTYPALLAAGTLATLDRICVHHRERRHGGLLSTTGRRHFDLFEQYERVFAFIDERPELAPLRPLVFRRMADHFLAVFTTRARLPRGSRAEFFRRARAQYRRHRVPGGGPRTLRVRVRHGLVRLGAHRALLGLEALGAVRARAGRSLRALGRALRSGVLHLHYRIQLRLPLRDEAVFSAYGNGGYACNPAAIEAKVRELVPRVRTTWVAAPAHLHTVPPATARVAPDTFAYWTALARATYLVSNVEFDGRLVKRKGQVLLQTHHGTPLKTMGLDLMDRPAAARDTDFAALVAGSDMWDYSLSANLHSTLTWERTRPSGCTTLEYGYPRNDVFHRASAADVARLRDGLGIPPGATAVLYAPTHRDYRRGQHRPLDLERVARTLGPGVVLLTRAHPAYGAPLAEVTHPRIIDVSGHRSVEQLCLAADALVTDYSSLMFDYANLDRPIVIHADDWEAYEAARGTYFDLRAFPPGAVARTEDELIDIFCTGHWRGSRSAQLRAAFRARFCPHDDGHAAERVVRRVFLDQSGGRPPVVPLEDRRPAPAPAAAARRETAGLV
ncbi:MULTISPECIES: bifunctional glycosyltransferase family 2 protein/CDP-glycerol:glycerophosphate glycerophosphotransferase [unclassified Streptomyces]|uniref:bifunctional glycosyltransferase/CDP-glycerol:glycerophosphate glycerophosphotransferase n=1 Tax=unclassified Streptomyces TaxID=2593676 RepID=UPI0033F7C7EF